MPILPKNWYGKVVAVELIVRTHDGNHARVGTLLDTNDAGILVEKSDHSIPPHFIPWFQVESVTLA